MPSGAQSRAPGARSRPIELLPRLETFLIPGPAGRIDGRLELPVRPDPPRFIAVFAHPHPQHGGTMQNTVVVHGSRSLARLGGVVARFNFRGVGRSEGTFAEGAGERDDYLAVMAYLAVRWPRTLPRLAAGFSFGAIRALEVCALGAADLYLGVAPPFTLPRYALPGLVATPAALVLAGKDELLAAPTEAELAARFSDLRAVEVVVGAGHLFFGRVREVAAAIARAAEKLPLRG
jgi:hypothetical protein